MADSPFRNIRTIIAAISGLALAWVFGLVWYAQQVPDSVLNQTKKTDAIVVLTGGSERIDTGLDLLARNLASQLFISGVAPNVTVTDLLSIDLQSSADLTERITTGSEAEDTPGNAVESARWIRLNNVTSIRLVTAAYHMPRALYEFRHAIPEVQIIPHPVFPDQVKKDWWRYPGTASLLAREYSKHLLSVIRLWLISTTDASDPKDEQ